MPSAELTASTIRADNPGALRRLLRSPALRSLKYRILGSRFFRRLFTRNFSSGLVALGERNSYAFPMGWITVDWSQADFSFWLSKDSSLPFADNSQRVVYSSHMMEHVEDDALERLLQEIHRILKPGGAVRIEVPDADKLVAAYRNRDRALLDYFREGREDMVRRFPALGEKYLEDHLTVLGEIANYIDYTDGAVHIPVYADKSRFEEELDKGLPSFNRWAQGLKTPDQRNSGGHANALTAGKMSDMLRSAGFSTVEVSTLGRTAIPGLKLGRGLRRLYDSVPETASRAFYSLYIEAFK
jgi:SAM-dependent methyltransferase